MDGHGGSRRLTESALLMAVSVVLFFGAFIPFIGIVVAPFSPLPITILTKKYGFRHGGGVALLTLFSLTLMFTIPMGVAFAPFVFVGWTIGFLSRHDTSGGRIAMKGIAATVIMLMTVMLGYDWFARSHPTLGTIDETIVRVFQDSREVGRHLLKEGSPTLERYEENLVLLERFGRIVLAVPLLFCTIVGGMGFMVTYLFGYLLLAKVGHPIPRIEPFHAWQGPWWLTWGMVISYAATHLESIPGWDGFPIYAYNFFGIFFLIYLTLGLSIIDHGLVRYKLNPVVRAVVLLIATRLAFWPVPIVMVIALLDPWIDFRRVGGDGTGVSS